MIWLVVVGVVLLAGVGFWALAYLLWEDDD
jgi:hypothetical protein